MSVLILIAILGFVLLFAGLIIFRKRKSSTHLVIALLLMGLAILSLLITWGLLLMALEDAQN